MALVTNGQIIALRKQANKLRQHILVATHAAGSGHPGTSLSAVEIVTAIYFGHVMRYDPENPDWDDRDRFVMSKGHGAPLLYAALAEAGFFSVELIPELRKIGSPLPGHPDHRVLPGVEASTGSLGQGLSIGNGMALAARLKKSPARIFVLLGDGEMQEGQVWEALLFAGHHKLDNLTAIVDYNKFQLDGPIKEILDLEPLVTKIRSFNWEVEEIEGHDFAQVLPALKKKAEGRPKMIIAHTVKGKGISFMENNNHFHGVAPNDEEFQQAMKELKEEQLRLDAYKN